MTGATLKSTRENANLTQEQAAARLGVTQPYLSMVENGRRAVSSSLASLAMKIFEVPATALPLDMEKPAAWAEGNLKDALGALGYPGFAYLRSKQRRNPAQVLLQALNYADLDARIVEALPWLVYTYADMDWDWLLRNAKLNDLQNRLGFVAGLAEETAKNAGDDAQAKRLGGYRSLFERSRLAREDTLCHDSMTQAERKWLRRNRPSKARHWNLLTDLDVRHLAYVPA